MRTTPRHSSRRPSTVAAAIALLLPALPLLAQAPAASAPVPLSAAPAAAPKDTPAAPLVNQREPLPGIRTGGVPATPEGYRALADAGFRTFVDLRGDAEVKPETRAAAESAGLVYERIPIAGDADLDLGTARRLHALLEDPAHLPVVLACASGNRVGALMAVEAFWLRGEKPEPALELGRSAGLTRLEPAVRQLLGLPPLPPSAAPATTTTPPPAH